LALNSTPRRRFGVALGVVLTGVTAGLIGFTGIASAHTPRLSAECKGDTTTLSVRLDAYNGKQVNTVKITDGDKVLDEAEFRVSYPDGKSAKTFSVPGNVDHKFTVSVKAWDDKSGKEGWTFDKTLEVKACVTPPSTETTTTTTDVPPSTETTTTTTQTTETTTTTTSAEAPPTTPAPTTTTPAEVKEEALAETGASIGLPLGIAGVLLVGGGVLLFVVRRRSKA
jgi:LPXTG-motif cell wall-anchored protein